MEDYKKKYEDLVKDFGQILNLNTVKESGVISVDDVRHIIPELKESEDERIRKAIIEYLEQSQFGEEHYLIDDNVVRGYISWLEKQGEQKPQDKPALEVWKDMRLEVYQQASGNRHEPNYSDDSTKMFSEQFCIYMEYVSGEFFKSLK